MPSGRVYEPGTNTLITSWKTPTGWATARDALMMGPRRGEDMVTPHTRPPADDDGDHMLVRTVACVEGTVEVELVCEPGFDYGRVLGEWTLSEDRHSGDMSGAGQTIRLMTDMLLGVEANRVRARHALHEGEELYCALTWAEALPAPATFEEANARLGGRRHASGAVVGSGPYPRPRVASVDPALGARDQGADVHADRARRSRR